jgi:hypothetical protein
MPANEKHAVASLAMPVIVLCRLIRPLLTWANPVNASLMSIWFGIVLVSYPADCSLFLSPLFAADAALPLALKAQGIFLNPLATGGLGSYHRSCEKCRKPTSHEKI